MLTVLSGWGQKFFYTQYGAAAGLDNRILVIKESERGRLYAAGIGPETYLYRYEPAADAFINLSLPLPFAHSQGFEVHDLADRPAGHRLAGDH